MVESLVINDQILSLKSILEALSALRRETYPDSNWKYRGFEELVLDCGILMEALLLPPTIQYGSPKQCYWNCQKLVFKRKDLTYVEGFALIPRLLIPVAHAWLLTSEGEAIDPTWNPVGAAYCGVPLSTKWVKSFLASRKQRTQIEDFSIFEGNYLEQFSLLKQGLPPAAYPTHSFAPY